MKDEEMNLTELPDLIHLPKLKRSTQQYCKKCLTMSSEYGLVRCSNCDEKFDEHWLVKSPQLSKLSQITNNNTNKNPVKAIIKRLKTI
jgi:hypothetical protein